MSVIPDMKVATRLTILRSIHEYNVVQSYPKLKDPLKIFLSLPIIVASCERSFSKLKKVLKYNLTQFFKVCRSIAEHHRLCALKLLNCSLLYLNEFFAFFVF